MTGQWDPDSPAQRALLEHVRCPACRSLAIDDLTHYLGPSATGMSRCRRCWWEFVGPVVPSEATIHGTVPWEPCPTVHEPGLNIKPREQGKRRARRRSP